MTNLAKFPDLDHVPYPYAGATAIDIGDLVFVSDGNVVPATSLTGTGSQAGDATAFVPSFAGVARERKLATDIAGHIDVTPFWLGDVPCVSTVWNVGDLVTVVENGSNNGLLSQQVQQTTDTAVAIGVCVRDSGGVAATTVRVFLQSRMTPLSISGRGSLFSEGLTIGDGGNVAVGSTTGSKFGTARGAKTGIFRRDAGEPACRRERSRDHQQHRRHWQRHHGGGDSHQQHGPKHRDQQESHRTVDAAQRHAHGAGEPGPVERFGVNVSRPVAGSSVATGPRDHFSLLPSLPWSGLERNLMLNLSTVRELYADLGAVGFAHKFHQMLGLEDPATGRKRISLKTQEPVLESQTLLPEHCSLKALYQGLVGYDDGQMLMRGASFMADVLEDGGTSIVPSAFSNVSAYNAAALGLLEAKFLEVYRRPTFIAEQLAETVPTNKIQEKFIGISTVGDVAEERKPGNRHMRVNVSERYVTTPSNVNRAVAVDVTREAVMFDRTRELLTQAEKSAEVLALRKEYIVLDTFLGVNNTYTYNGTNYNTYQTSGNWVNDQSNPLVDWTQINAALQLFSSMTDQETGQPIDSRAA